MLETFREHTKGWLAKLILALITIPFALWGIDSYLQDAGTNVAVAEVDHQNVTMQEYANAMQNLRYRLQADGKTDPALLEDPAVKRSVIDELVMQKLLSAEVRDAKFALADESLANYIITLPEFQKDGKFSQEQYDAILSQNRLTPSQFESRMRGELIVQQARDGVAAAAFAPETTFGNLLAIEQQQREVSTADISADAFLADAKVTPEEIKAYYEKHKDKFRVPEQVKIEYVLFSANNLIANTQVTDEEARKYYAENAGKFSGDEQRRASHILISFGSSSDAAAKQAAREKAEAVLAEVRQNPDKFADLAKKYSQDTGSAAQGGDLGLFGRGMMVKPFEDAVFGLTPGGISDLVESEFGFHIIKLTEIQGSAPSFEEMRANIRAELMYQKSLAKFVEEAEKFSNMVYEQFDSLKPAAEALGLQVQSSQWMSREDAQKFFKNERLVNALFSDELLKEKRNSEAIEVAANTLLSARVVDHKPSAARSFEEVEPALQEFLKHEQAVAMANRKGAELLASLREGKEIAELEWMTPVVIDRKNNQGLQPAAAQEAFRVDTAELPAYSGMEVPRVGYKLIRVSRVESPQVTDKDERALHKNEVQTALSEEFLRAYLTSLRSKSEIKINEKLIGINPQ